MISISEFVGIRLGDFRRDGVAQCAAEIQRVMRRQSANGMLASGNTISAIEQAITEIYRETLTLGASFISEADPDDPQQHVGALDMFGRSFERDAVRQYETDFPRMGDVVVPFELRREAVSKELAIIRDRTVGDFKFGIAGGRRMTRKPTIDNRVIFNAPVSGSPAIAPGGIINQHITPSDEGLRELADRILTELNAATAAAADARRLAEEARVELAKPNPDRSLLVRLLTRVGNGLLLMGKTALAELTKAVVKAYADEFGIIPPRDE